MSDVWAVLGALATVVLPIALAWWLLGRPPRAGVSHRDPHGKMLREEDR